MRSLGKIRTWNLSVLSQALYHLATALPISSNWLAILALQHGVIFHGNRLPAAANVFSILWETDLNKSETYFCICIVNDFFIS